MHTTRDCGWAPMVGAVLMVLAMASVAPAQQLRTLANFDSTNGAYPDASLVQATDGNFYGTTADGGNNRSSKICPSECGTVFKVSPTGTLTTLYNFCGQTDCADGAGPGSLVQGTDGNFYGTTGRGGDTVQCPDGCGTVFKITPAGKLTTLYSFCAEEGCLDGGFPFGLIQATDGDLYGTTSEGGAGNDGTIFKITVSGSLTTLFSFCAQTCADGRYPNGLMQATDGNFYGTTADGGTHYRGTFFKITPTGTLTTLYSFCDVGDCPYLPDASLVQGTDGNFYGTTYYGGGGSRALCPSGCGAVFKVTPTGELTTLHGFCSQANCTDGKTPLAPVIEGTDGNFYGTTDLGGAYTGKCDVVGCGTVFQITPSGVFTTMVLFDYTDGSGSLAGLVQATSGAFYGTTNGGGDAGYGTIFTLNVGLGPFVEPQPTSGKVGSTVKILGTGLPFATGVSFNGTAATFKVQSSSLITATVPPGATTGPVQVTLPRGTLTSNVNFQVLP